MEATRALVVCDNMCGCPTPCPRGDGCRCAVTSAGAVREQQHTYCPCGSHCGCSPCTCGATAASQGVGKANCNCGEGCGCSTCAACNT